MDCHSRLVLCSLPTELIGGEIGSLRTQHTNGQPEEQSPPEVETDSNAIGVNLSRVICFVRGSVLDGR